MTKPWAGSALMHAALAAQYPAAQFTCNLDTGEITAWKPGAAPDDAAIEAAVDAYLAASPWPPPAPAFTSYATLRERMTESEREAVLTLRRANWRIDDFVTWAAGAGERIDLKSAGVAEAKAALTAAGVFSSARADEVFSL